MKAYKKEPFFHPSLSDPAVAANAVTGNDPLEANLEKVKKMYLLSDLSE